MKIYFRRNLKFPIKVLYLNLKSGRNVCYEDLEPISYYAILMFAFKILIQLIH